MIRVLAILIIFVALGLIWLWLDPDEPQPYFADEDWVWETDPYLDRAHRVTHNPPYGHLLCS